MHIGLSTLTIVRHPKPQIASGVCYGHFDIPAQPKHLQECVNTLGSALVPQRIEHVVTSDLQRCQSYAQALGLPYQVNPIWRERNFGDWEGKSWDSIDRRALDAWAGDPYFFAPPNGESLWQMLQRILIGLDGLPTNSLIIAHAGVARCFDLLLNGKNIYAGASLDYGLGRQFKWNRQWWPHRYGAEGALLQQLATAHRGHGVAYRDST